MRLVEKRVQMFHFAPVSPDPLLQISDLLPVLRERSADLADILQDPRAGIRAVHPGRFRLCVLDELPFFRARRFQIRVDFVHGFQDLVDKLFAVIHRHLEGCAFGIGPFKVRLELLLPFPVGAATEDECAAEKAGEDGCSHDFLPDV